TGLLDAGIPDEAIARVAETWQPLPALTFLCQAPVELCLDRIAGRGAATDDFSSEPVLRKYQGLFEKAMAYARAQFGLRGVELDTDRPGEAVLEAVKETPQWEGLPSEGWQPPAHGATISLRISPGEQPPSEEQP